MSRFLYFLYAVNCCAAVAYGQCSVPAAPSASGCVNLSNGNVGSFQNVTSGTFCVTQTLSGWNAGGNVAVFVQAGGSLDANLNGGTVVYQGGTIAALNGTPNSLRVQSSTTLSNYNFNANTNLVVENGATLTVNSGGSINNDIYMANGTLTFNVHEVQFNGGASVCFANNSRIIAKRIDNNQSGLATTTASNQKGCFLVQNNPQGNNFNNTLASTSRVYYCTNTGTLPGGLGSATGSPSCSNCNIAYALPVTLVSFGAENQPTGVEVSWSTTAEINHDYFVVERSADAHEFAPVSERIRQPISQTDARRFYVWLDEAALPGNTYYYRLRQVDTDGTTAFSRLSGITAGSGENPALRLAPNPAVTSVNVTLGMPGQGRYELTLYDAQASRLRQVVGQKQEPAVRQTLNVADLPAGTYYVVVRINGYAFIQKLLKR